MVVQLCRMAFINKNIAPEGWLISISSVGTPLFISFLGFTYIELQMDKLLPKSECRFYLDGMTLIKLSRQSGPLGSDVISHGQP